MAEHNESGNRAEEIALAYLRNQGYTIRETNWRYYSKEIDIIAEKDNKIIILEVKSRSERNYESVSELFSKRKMKNMVEAAEAYILKKNLFMEVRFDFFVVVFGQRGPRTEHIPGAFIPGVNW